MQKNIYILRLCLVAPREKEEKRKYQGKGKKKERKKKIFSSMCVWM